MLSGRVRAAHAIFIYGVIALIATVAPAQAQSGSALPAPWSAQDIGSPAIAGGVSSAPGSFTISAGGTDIWDTADQFHFVYQQITGDVDVIARVDSLGATDSWAKSGVMIRSSLAANASHGFALVSAANGLAFQRRTQDGAISEHTAGPPAAAPRWVRIVRAGTTLTAYSSADGKSWSTMGSSTVALQSAAYVGLAVTSHNAGAATTSTLSQVAVVPLTLPGSQQAADVGGPAIAGSTAYWQGRYTIHAGGTDIWDTADQFHFVYQQVTGDLEVVARVSSLSDTDSWAKTGLMIRETLNPGSRHASAFVTPIMGYAFQRRVSTGGYSDHTDGPKGAAPGWVRLVRTGSQVEAFQSSDGTTWTSMGSDAVPMADPVYVGIATTSHNATRATDAVLDSFTLTTAASAANQAPSVAIVSPTDGTTVTAGTDLTVTAAASDGDGTISRVDIFAGTTLIGSATAAPYEATWRSVPAGTYALTAVAVDNDGAKTTSTSVSVTAQQPANQSPSVTLTSPANGASFTAPATVALSATASDPENSLQRVEFYSGTTLLASDSTAPYSYTWSSVPAGSYSLRAVAYDTAGASATSATATITVAAANQPPTVTLRSPGNGAAYTAPASIALSAAAADSDGAVARVEFYAGTTLLNTDTTAPYAFTWSSVAEGSYALRAVAYDNAGASASSATATVVVSAANSNGVVGEYAMDEGTGTLVADESGAGPRGTVTGATWTTGKFGQALSFAGSGEVAFGDVDLPGSFTVMGWLQTRSLFTSACGSFVMKAHDYGFEICGGRLYAAVGANGAWTARLSQPLTTADLNVWKHVALTYDGATLRMYVGGVLVTSAAATHTTNDNPLLFGHWVPAGEYWDGLVDEVRLYSRSLTESEIQATMNTPIGPAVNQPPTVALTAPANGATFAAPATVDLSATASDPENSLARVEFYSGSTLLATDTTAPYSFTWSSVPAGSYAIRAVAYDGSGASASSATSTITVTAGTTSPPTGVVFQASSDHATLVTRYELRIYAAGSDPATATPVATSDLGKPTPDASGDITVDRSAFFSNLAPGNYVAAVAALGDGGSSTSTAVAFTR